MRKLLLLLWLFSITWLLGGCGQVAAPSNPALTPSTVQADAQPTPSLPAPAPDTGIVVGSAIWQGSQSQAVSEIDLYLAEVSEVEEGGMALARLDPGSSPKATLDETGYFIFVDVAPGTYALVAAISPADSALVPDPETAAELTIVVVAGEVVDLGTIYVPKLY